MCGRKSWRIEGEAQPAVVPIALALIRHNRRKKHAPRLMRCVLHLATVAVDLCATTELGEASVPLSHRWPRPWFLEVVGVVERETAAFARPQILEVPI